MKKIHKTGAIGLAMLTAAPAFAHHPLGGMQMETFAHGVLSGVGHPVLGFDHLFFVALVGIAAVFTGRAKAAPAAYIGAMLMGCLLMTQGFGLPLKEFAIGLSLLILGGVVLFGRALSMTSAMLLFAGFGLFHGSAFGDSIAGQEAAMGASVIMGYLIGLGVIQYAIAIATGLIVAKLWNATEATAIQPRLAGAMVAGIGVFLTLENTEGLVFDALGWSV